ncbi:hypothetical protein KAU11_06605, partial [Candidatus Babeliales bacterium]|nr:hypothetical protein [Candidatus Babeliales bacterium]
KKSNKWLTLVFIVFALIVLAIAGYFAYQNYGLKEQLKAQSSDQEVVPTEIPQPTQANTTLTPSLAPTADPTENWETYENEIFSIKAPKEYVKNNKISQDGDLSLEYNNITARFFFTKILSKHLECFSNDEVFNQDVASYEGAINAGSKGHYKIVNSTTARLTLKGIEYWTPELPLVIYQYPICFHNTKFNIKFSIAGNINQAREVFPQLEQILSTFEFVD